MSVESFANDIIRENEIGTSRDYALDRLRDPVIQVVASLNRMKAERRLVQAETSECICYRLTEKGKIDIVAAEPDRLQILNGQISVLDVDIAKHQAVLQNLEEFFGDDPKDASLVGLEKRLQTAQTGISRYESAVRNVGVSVLAGYKNNGRWNLENIREHPSVQAERAKSDSMISRYKADVVELESKIKALRAILAGKCV